MQDPEFLFFLLPVRWLSSSKSEIQNLWWSPEIFSLQALKTSSSFVCNRYNRAFKLGTVFSEKILCFVFYSYVWWGVCMVCLGGPHYLGDNTERPTLLSHCLFCLDASTCQFCWGTFYCFVSVLQCFPPSFFLTCTTWCARLTVTKLTLAEVSWLEWPALPSTSRVGKASCQHSSHGNIMSASS